MVSSIDRARARAFGKLIEQSALAGDWAKMRRFEAHWVAFSIQYHGRDRTELCQSESDGRITLRQLRVVS